MVVELRYWREWDCICGVETLGDRRKVMIDDCMDSFSLGVGWGSSYCLMFFETLMQIFFLL